MSTRTLRCGDCGRTYEDGPGAPYRCTCGTALDLADPPRPAGPAPDPATLDPRDGLWAFDPFLPVPRPPTLGEGWTPLVDAPDPGVTYQLEYVSPTGSFKDRGAVTAVARALDVGVDRVVEDSSGNAGQAVATYAARAGLDATVYVPADAKPAKLRAVERAGAELVRVEGSRADVTAACVAAVEDGDAWYASHAWDPLFYAGTATTAYEIAAARDWTVPDAVVLPVGHGTLLLGMYRGFRALAAAGWTDRVPALHAGQAAGYAPVVEAVHGASAAAGTNERADGIQITAPARLAQVVAAVETTGGDAVAVDAAAVDRELDRLHAAGFYTEPTCAVAPAALAALRDRGAVEPGADVVVPLTGSGLKTTADGS